MRSKLLSESDGVRTFVVVLDPGEEAFRSLSDIAAQHNITAARVTAIGAFESAIVGRFDFASRSDRKIPVAEQCEVLSAIGDIAAGDDGKTSLHMHVVLGFSDGSTRAGHLLEGVVHPTLEVMMTEMPAPLHRKKRPELGIALVDL